jgi:short-subunit dehydrogenase
MFYGATGIAGSCARTRRRNKPNDDLPPLHSITSSVDRAPELTQKSIPGGLHDPTTALSHLRLDHLHELTFRFSRLGPGGKGRILITGSEAGFVPGTFHAVYNGTKAFIDSFSFALRAELKNTGVTVTCLMPGDRDRVPDMTDTKVGQSSKDDPAEVARAGFDAMMRGDGNVATGWRTKLKYRMIAVCSGKLCGLRTRVNRGT